MKQKNSSTETLWILINEILNWFFYHPFELNQNSCSYRKSSSELLKKNQFFFFFLQIMGHISRTEKAVMSEINLELLFMVPDLVYKFQMTCLREMKSMSGILMQEAWTDIHTWIKLPYHNFLYIEKMGSYKNVLIILINFTVAIFWSLQISFLYLQVI